VSRADRLTAIVGLAMNRARRAPHADTLEAAVPHFNESFRVRYHLPSVTIQELRAVPGLDEDFADLATVRANGVRDASCALVAQVVLSIVPRYAIGYVDNSGKVTVQAPDGVNDEAYWESHVLLVNPLGGEDNWTSASRWFRTHGGKQARRSELAGLASEDRPDEAAELALVERARAVGYRGAIGLPPDEAFSAELAAEVSYIYDVPVETLRAWKQRNRAKLAARRPGAPRKNR
jgi:hypothetical protein